VVEIGAGQKWDKSLQARLMPVFGVSGALPLFRRSALQATILPSGQVFDESYVMYKEDVDLAFRLRQAGFKACVVEQTVAYHDRTAHHGSNLSDFSALKGKRQQSDFIAYHSYKNHLATLYTNEYFQNFILDFPFIVWYEIKKFGYFLLFNPSILKGLWQLWKARKELRKKRAAVKIARKVSGKELRRWFI
jgi:GT2 family glycosyltransferase